ncbi:MAG: U32 family peptidase [Spirochaetaceae bacterium]|nr:U32 family peptidase [Spirochaetaceae bacterium]
MNQKIELLSPAGDSDAFKAAILAGANAIYFGLEKFSARTRATNLTLSQLEELAPLAKSRSVRLYLTLNTLVRDCEIGDALRLAETALERGVDAIIVQDFGLMAALRAHFPQAEIHASTQMTTHNLAQLDLLARAGISQVNLSRELSIEQIKLFSEKLKNYGIVPEVFVHGAYCISYSGQCYLSGALYGQAGNRGSCVQPCRRQFFAGNGKLIAPFSLKDNCAFSFAKELCSVAPISLKIEGRIKSAEYVYSVTKSWREQLDLIEAGKAVSKESELLDKSFNRGFATDYLEGCPTKDFFNFGEKDATMQKAGTVQSFRADKMMLKISGSMNGTGNRKSIGGAGSASALLEQNDRLLIKTKDGRFICNAEVCKAFQNGTSDASEAQIKITGKLNGRIEKGQIVYKSSPAIEAQNLKKQLDALKPLAVPLSIEVSGKLNEQLVCKFSTDGAFVIEKTAAVLEKASKHGLDEETLRQKLGKLGGTIFALEKLDAAKLEDGLFIALPELNGLRRRGTQKLAENLAKAEKVACKFEPNANQIDWSDLQDFAHTEDDTSAPTSSNTATPKLAFFCSSISQAAEMLQARKTVIFELPLVISDETQQFLAENETVIPHFQSILFEEDFNAAKACLEKLAATKSGHKRQVWCENTGLADFAQKAGFSVILGSFCNAANSMSIQAYAKLLGIAAIVPSIEISYEAISNLIVPQNVKLFYPLFSEELLMQSRQCLVRNLTGCTKAACDRTCIEQCEKQFAVKGTADEAFRAVKRKSFYSGLFSAKPVSNAKAFNILRHKIDTWFVDLRFQDSVSEKRIIEAAEDFANKSVGSRFSEPFNDAIEKKFWFGKDCC